MLEGGLRSVTCHICSEVIGAGAQGAERHIFRVRRTYAAMRTVTCCRLSPVHGAEGGVMCSEVIGRGGRRQSAARRKPVTCPRGGRRGRMRLEPKSRKAAE